MYGTKVKNAHNYLEKIIGTILQVDQRVTKLRQLAEPKHINKLADEIFGDLPEKIRTDSLSTLVELLIWAQDPLSGSPLLSARYHIFLRALEGAFVSYFPQKQIYLEKRSSHAEESIFEVALCRECGQHYLVGRIKDGMLEEAIRDLGHPDFGATFFQPIEEIAILYAITLEDFIEPA